MVLKTCKKCLQEKSLDEFYPHPRMHDGHLNKCKDCARADVTENRARNVEYYRNYDRLRYDEGRHFPNSPANDNRDRAKRWYTKNPEKKRAHAILARAIKAGKIRKPRICEDCGRFRKRIEGHHEDYSKPLSVRWLCKRCHSKTWTKPRLNLTPRHRGGYVGPMKPSRAA